MCLVANGSLLFAFTKFTNLAILCVNRVLVGIFQAYIIIYFPLWCDQFGIKKKKTIMISILQTGVPLGIVIGYVVTGVIKIYKSVKLI